MTLLRPRCWFTPPPALEELIIEGYPTNASLAHLIMHDPEFVRGQYDTSFLDKNLDRLLELARTCDRLMDEEETP